MLSALVLSSLAAHALTQPSPPSSSLILHEWGTFTTVMTPQGQPILWRPLLAPGDLPDFVYGSVEGTGLGTELPADVSYTKAGTLALVRMETPVIYFYSDDPEPVSVDLSVSYTAGRLTEWFPRAELERGFMEDTLRWQRFLVLPRGVAPPLPDDGSGSHYFEARAVGANLVQDPASGEVERFLFYRGVGNARPEISLSEDDEGVVQIVSSQDRGGAVMMVSDAETVCWAPVAVAAGRTAAPALQCGDEAALEATMVAELAARGLYRDEAEAMVATWRTHWLEPGTRLLSIVPPATTDALLPLSVSPAPQETVRVMVERTELLRSADVVALTAAPTRASAEQIFGRFADAGLAAAGLPTDR